MGGDTNLAAKKSYHNLETYIDTCECNASYSKIYKHDNRSEQVKFDMNRNTTCTILWHFMIAMM